MRSAPLAPRFNQVLALTVFSVLLPTTSFDDTLQVLSVPLAWLILLTLEASREGRRVPAAELWFVLFGIVLSPEIFLAFHHIMLAGSFKAVALLVLMAAVLCIPVPDAPALLPAPRIEAVQSAGASQQEPARAGPACSRIARSRRRNATAP